MIENHRMVSFVVVIFIFTPRLLYSQAFTLQQCMEIAGNDNKSINIADENRIQKQLEFQQAKSIFVPSINISNQHNISTGRVLDPTTYQFLTNRTVYDMSTTIGISMTIFSGFERFHRVKKAELNVADAETDLEKTKNSLKLEVIRLFLEILMDKEAIEICDNKIGLLEKQEDLIAKKVEYQAATQGDLMNIQADIMRAQVDRSAAFSELYLDKVSMCELLEIDDWEHFDVVFDEDPEAPRMWSSSDVFIYASGLPQIRKKEISVEMAKRDAKIASSSFWPTIKLNAGYGTTFSNARIKSSGEDYNFYDQLRDNMSSYVSLSLNFPILSAITTSHAVKARKYAVRTSELELQRTLTALDKEVKQAVVQVNTAYEKYRLLEKEVEKDSEALRQTEVRYNSGAATYYDYQIAVGNLFQAQAERIQAQYEYIYRTKIMDYYSGNLLY